MPPMLPATQEREPKAGDLRLRVIRTSQPTPREFYPAADCHHALSMMVALLESFAIEDGEDHETTLIMEIFCDGKWVMWTDQKGQKNMVTTRVSMKMPDDEEVKRALNSIVHFITMFDKMPMHTADEFYGIHNGTEYEANLRLSDFRIIKRLVECSSQGVVA